jgi:cytoskeletal protein RodZ
MPNNPQKARRTRFIVSSLVMVVVFIGGVYALKHLSIPSAEVQSPVAVEPAEQQPGDEEVAASDAPAEQESPPVSSADETSSGAASGPIATSGVTVIAETGSTDVISSACAVLGAFGFAYVFKMWWKSRQDCDRAALDLG